MTSASKTLAASAAALFTFGFFVITAPTAHADDYCITSGAQAAHGCGYPSMEMCQAASAGIGGICKLSAPSANSSDALAYQPRGRHQRSARRPRNEPAGN